jgi:hypothetical protein
MRWAGHIERSGMMRGTYGLFFGKLDGKRQFGRPKGRLENDIKINIQGTGCEHMGRDQ